ncbi:hypothetical protein F5I97DRAFT_1828231 [Phlebopus sp. FC_14]|nr:hypothetical protein F5I97DRAFT_1828231 [Phlebopus sp. FC_14]
MHSPTKASIQEASKEQTRKVAKNVVIFGECGVGKSSLINLIAGAPLAETSSGAMGCTFEYRRYLLTLDDQSFGIWDTAGLDEGTYGTVPAEKAEGSLMKASSIDLLVYCVRGTRVRSALLGNYRIFHSAICRKKVPIVLVVTGLENQVGPMESWWSENEKEFQAFKMYFDGHACVTTLQLTTPNDTLQRRLTESKAAATDLIGSTCRKQQWKVAERSWVETALSDIRAILRPNSDVSQANVIMCDVSRRPPVGSVDVRRRAISFHNPVTLSLSIRPLTFRNPISLVSEKTQKALPFDDRIKFTTGKFFRVYQVSPKPIESGDKWPKKVIQRGADLLIFCVEKDGPDVKAQWGYFHSTYGGDISPQIVIVVGASDQMSAYSWWNVSVGDTDISNDVEVTFWPGNLTGDKESEEAKARLRGLIRDHCIDCSILSSRNKDIFRNSTDVTRWRNSGIKIDVSEGDVLEEQDVLTKWGVWEDIRIGENTFDDPNGMGRLGDVAEADTRGGVFHL